MSRDLTYLEDIRDAADRAITHVGGASSEILRDDLFLQDGVVRCLILVGEAARQVSSASRERFPHFDWAGMIGLRNVLVHRYREVDFVELWTIVTRDLPPLVEELGRYLRDFE